LIQEHAITTRGDKAVAIYELETHFAMAVRQRELLEQYIKERLKPGKHFYTIDDELGRKPSLTKEGAELICLPHALKAHYSWLSGPENPPLDDAPYQITMQCDLESNGKFAGGGVGSANSMITKKDGSRAQRQKDPGLRHNATLKMACKSAYIAATLNSTAASEFFTQDLEDDQTDTGVKPDKRGHFCKEHNAVFFKKGKMKNFAHPIGDTGEWCNEGVVVEGTATVNAVPDPDSHEPPTPAPVKAEAKEKPAAVIDMVQLKKDLDTLGWTEVIKWLRAKFNVTGAKVSEIVAMLTPEEQREFEKEVKERLELK